MGKMSVVGAGLVGSLWARMLGNRGHEVVVYERRPDPRKGPLHGGRSINLALSDRGWKALELAGVADQVRDIALPIRGRRMHAVDGTRTFQPYGLDGQCIYSVSRARLNRILVEAAEAMPNVHFAFDHRCQGYTKDDGHVTLHLENNGRDVDVPTDRIFGTDGAFSAIRGRMMRNDRFDFEQSYLPHGYKEVPMMPGADGTFQMEEDGLHIWPRGTFMLMALPNPDKTFTCTLFAPYEGPDGLNQLTTDEAVHAFFTKHFPDVMPLLPNLLEDWKTHPVSSLVMTRCFPWNDGERVALMGDSAHAIVPFYGQGMNSGMEDCTVLDGLLDTHEDWAQIMERYTALRKPAGDAILELALQNYIEMRDLTGDPRFLQQKKLEGRLQRKHPDRWLPLYSQVTFSHTPYHEALAQGKRQQQAMETVMNDPEKWNHFEGDEWMDAALAAVKNLESPVH
jgi:kynurenine 3-monooxygenase